MDGREQAVILMADAAQRWPGISAVKSYWLSAHSEQAAAPEVLHLFGLCCGGGWEKRVGCDADLWCCTLNSCTLPVPCLPWHQQRCKVTQY